MRVHILCRSETQSNIYLIIALKRKKPDSFYLKFNNALWSNVAVCDQWTKSSLEREKNYLRLIYFPGDSGWDKRYHNGSWTECSVCRPRHHPVTPWIVDRDIEAVIAPCYGLDGPGVEYRWRRDFPHSFRPALGPNQNSVQWVLGLSRG
jgi:hypothetical protein